MMFIEKRPEGWTVVQRETGAVMLKDPTGQSPWFLPTEEEVLAQCRAAKLMPARAGNPGNWPEGALLELSWEAKPLGAGAKLETYRRVSASTASEAIELIAAGAITPAQMVEVAREALALDPEGGTPAQQEALEMLATCNADADAMAQMAASTLRPGVEASAPIDRPAAERPRA